MWNAKGWSGMMLALLVEDLTDAGWLCGGYNGRGFVEGRPGRLSGLAAFWIGFEGWSKRW